MGQRNYASKYLSNYIFLSYNRYKITGKEIEIESLKIHWTCLYGGQEEHFEDDLEYDSRGYEITKPKQK